MRRKRPNNVEAVIVDAFQRSGVSANMNIPILILLGFAAWTLLTLSATIGVYRWRRILTGTASVAEWRADLPQGSEWYQRAMRAHMNCVENLPVYTAVVFAVTAIGLKSAMVDNLAMTLLAARVGQTLVHIGLQPTRKAGSRGLRFCRSGRLHDLDGRINGCRNDTRSPLILIMNKAGSRQDFNVDVAARLDMPVAVVIRFSFPRPLYRGMRSTR